MLNVKMKRYSSSINIRGCGGEAGYWDDIFSNSSDSKKCWIFCCHKPRLINAKYKPKTLKPAKAKRMLQKAQFIKYFERNTIPNTTNLKFCDANVKLCVKVALLLPKTKIVRLQTVMIFIAFYGLNVF